ncbi:hypothetical protein B0H11DRAFT_1020021 [Mycena galericulata]|nr:hypothetical protein B0H11DRAFT_1020021 [Mycena galericulata]
MFALPISFGVAGNAENVGLDEETRWNSRETRRISTKEKKDRKKSRSGGSSLPHILFSSFLRHPACCMGNNQFPNDPRAVRPSSSTMSVQNVSRLAASESTTRLDVEAPPFQPKLARSDTTVAQAGSPSRRLDDDESFNKGNPNTSATSSANSSFPLSESALPASFDTSGDLAPAQLSHFFPLPPTKISSQKPTPSTFASSTSPDRSAVSASKAPSEQASLQEALDAIWAPPKQVSVRISAPVSPISPIDGPLIDFSCETMPTMPSLLACSTPNAHGSSADTSFEAKSMSGSTSGYQSGNSSGFDINVKVNGEEPADGTPMHREETLTELVASHPELNFGLLDPSSKKDPQLNSVAAQTSTISVVLAAEDEPIQLPPVTYADAANIANKYPELAAKVLNEPLATPVRADISLPDVNPLDEEAEHFFNPQETINTSLKEEPIVPAMPAHTPDHPNWALAPDEPEYYESRAPRLPRPARDRDWDRRGNGRREGSFYEQSQQDFDNAWQYGGGGGGGGGDRPQRGGPGRYPDQGRGGNEQEDYYNARNGAARRGWSQEPNFGANDRSHDTPPHLRGDDSYDQSYRLPSRPSNSEDSFNTHTPVKNENSAPIVDEWNPTHDAWATPATEQQPAETRPITHQEPAANHGGAPAQDAWGGPTQDAWGAPAHDPWAAPAEQPNTSHPTPRAQSSRLPAVPETDEFHTSAPRREETRDAPPVGNEWIANHDPWATPDENHGHQSQMLEPNNKHDAPPHMHGGGSPFRDRINDSTHQNDRSVNDGRFSGNVLDVRAPSQSSVAALAASRASEMYDRDGPDRTGSRNQDPAELPAEFNYFLHSETIDWTTPEPT